MTITIIFFWMMGWQVFFLSTSLSTLCLAWKFQYFLWKSKGYKWEKEWDRLGWEEDKSGQWWTQVIKIHYIHPWECYNDTRCICNYYTLIKTLITFCYQFNCYFSHYYSHLIALVMLELKSKALCILGKQFPTEL